MSSRWVRTLTFIVLASVLVIAAITVAACGTTAETTTTTVAPETTTTAGATTTSVAGETTTTGAPAVKITKIGVVAPEKGNDFGWNQMGVDSAKAIAKELGAEIVVSDGAGYGDIAPIYRQLVADKCDWIILWASGYNTVGPQLAQETGVKTMVVGAFDAGLVKDLSGDFETSAQEGSYLAGVLSAKQTKTGTVGVVISADDENWVKMTGGFIAGVKATDPKVVVKVAQVGQAAYADAPAAKRVTDSVIAAGADIIFGMGDGSSFGMIQAVESATPPKGAEKVYFIDVIGDKTSLDKKGILLSSAQWDLIPALQAAVADMAAGTYGTKSYYLDLSNGGMKLLKTDKITADAWAAVEAAQKGIADGTIKVPVTNTKADWEALNK